MRLEFYQTFSFQFEILPRITILYGSLKGIAIEWLWFGIGYFNQ